jgi:outer membrane immunogenic protein
LRILPLLSVVACTSSMIASAQAGDLSSTASVTNAPAYVPPPLTWAGFYVGAHLGGAWSEAEWITPVTATDASSIASGLLGGGQVGYNWQTGAAMWGIEGDFSGISLQSSNTGVGGFANTTSTHWMSTVTGRVGYASGRALIYGKGGVAIADEQDSVSSPSGALFSSTGTTTRAGWTMGGGLEYALNPHWSAKVEYGYLGLGSHGVSAAVQGGTPGYVDLNVQRIIGGINYRF